MFRNLYLTNRFFQLFGIVIVLFLLSFPIPILMPVALTAFVLAVALILVDGLRLFHKNVQVQAERRLPKMLSLSDQNTIHIRLQNNANIPIYCSLIDELPVEFQVRDFAEELLLAPNSEAMVHYPVRPVERGEYDFGVINLFLASNWGLVQRRVQQAEGQSIAVFPSIIQMKELELRAFNRMSLQQGIKKLRRIGHSYEFDHIKNYVRGDDYRSINWKASSRRGALMVNKYEDERAQQVYCIIDKSRNMRMPFQELSLMDYAINTTLALSNIILRKHDRAGLLTFSDKMGTTLKADNKPMQLNKILNALYKEKERSLEANYELLYYATRKLISGRSLILLFTNFESMYALDRVLPVLRRINRMHLLVIVFFENTEIKDFSQQKVQSLEDIYYQTVAQKFVAEKRAMVQKLQQFGIQAVLTRPEDLSINTINKYLELKARGLI